MPASQLLQAKVSVRKTIASGETKVSGVYVVSTRELTKKKIQVVIQKKQIMENQRNAPGLGESSAVQASRKNETLLLEWPSTVNSW